MKKATIISIIICLALTSIVLVILNFSNFSNIKKYKSELEKAKTPEIKVEQVKVDEFKQDYLNQVEIITDFLQIQYNYNIGDYRNDNKTFEEYSKYLTEQVKQQLMPPHYSTIEVKNYQSETYSNVAKLNIYTSDNNTLIAFVVLDHQEPNIYNKSKKIYKFGMLKNDKGNWLIDKVEDSFRTKDIPEFFFD